jgi:hypothetical protein
MRRASDVCELVVNGQLPLNLPRFDVSPDDESSLDFTAAQKVNILKS